MLPTNRENSQKYKRNFANFELPPALKSVNFSCFVIGLGKIIAISAAILGLSLIVFSRSTNLEICLILMFVIGMNNTLTLASINNFMQSILLDENKRGRVTSIFTTGFLGILPFGNLFFGALAGYLGVTNALLFGGICCIFGAYFFSRQLPEIRKILHPIYAELGLLTQSSKG